MTDVAQLLVDIRADIAGLQASLNQSKGHVDKFASDSMASIKKIAAALVAAFSIKEIGSSLLETTQSIEEMANSARALGIAVEDLQKLRFEAKQAGQSTDNLTTALGRMQASIQDASEGTGSAANAMQRLGLNAEWLKELPGIDQFHMIAQAFGGILDQTEKAKAGKEIFGKGWQETLRTFTSNTREADEKFKKFQLGLDKKQVNGLEEAGKEVKTLGDIWGSFKEQTASALATPFLEMSSQLENVIAGFGGMKSAGMDAASAILTGINYMVQGLAIADIAVGTLKADFEWFKGIGSRIGEAIYEKTHPTEANKDKSAYDIFKHGAQAGKSIEDTSKTIDATFKNVAAMDNLSKQFQNYSVGLEKQAEVLRKANAATDENGVVKKGIGTITNDKTGETFSVQRIQVDNKIELKYTDNFVTAVTQVVKQVNGTTMNDASRGVGN